MGDEQRALLARLADAVALMSNPAHDPTGATAALQYVEEFKEKEPNLANAGLALYDYAGDNLQLRHFALQLIQHFVSQRWPTATVETKNLVRQALLVRSETEMAGHLMTMLARVLVEILKRDWPTHWSDFMPEVRERATRQPHTRKMLIYVVQRLSEDIHLLEDAVPSQRRRQLRTDLSEELLNRGLLGELFGWVGSPSETGAVLACAATLFVWLPIEVVTEPAVLDTVYTLLSSKEHQSIAVDCLYSIINHQTMQPAQRGRLLMLLDPAPMGQLRECIRMATETNDWPFTQQLCKLIIGLGNHIIALWQTEEMKKRPEAFQSYLQFLLDMTRHPCQNLSYMSLEMWLKFLRSELVRESLKPIVKDFLMMMEDKLMRVGHPSKSNHPSCEYNKLEYMADEDYILFYGQYRGALSTTLANLAKIFPAESFEAMHNAIQTRHLNATGAGSEDVNDPGTDSDSIVVLRMGAFSAFVVILARQLNRAEYKEAYEGIVELWLSRGAQCYRGRPYITESFLTSLGAFSAHVGLAQLSHVVTEIFQSLYSLRPFKDTLPDFRRLHCDCLGVLITVAEHHGYGLFPALEQMFEALQSYLGSEMSEYMVEYNLSCEALLLIASTSPDFTFQLEFVDRLLQPLKQLLAATPDLRGAYDSLDNWVAFFGLSLPLVQCSSRRVAQDQLRFVTRTCFGIVRRLRPQTEENKQRLWDLVSPLVINVVRQVVYVTQITAEPRLVHPSVQAGLGLPAMDRKVLMGQMFCAVKKPEPAEDNLIAQVQTQISTTVEQGFNVFLHSAQYLSLQWFSSSEIQSSLALLLSLNIPFHAIKRLNRMVVAPILHNCPPELWQSVAAPLLGAYCPRFHKILADAWEEIGSTEEENEENEIIHAELTRLLTRDYLTMLNDVLLPKGRSSPEPPLGEEHETVSTTSEAIPLSEMGKMLLRQPELGSCITTTLLMALAWPDSQACRKAVALSRSAFSYFAECQLIAESDVLQIIDASLNGLAVCGQFEVCLGPLQSLVMGIYEGSYVTCPGVKQLLQMRVAATDQQMAELERAMVDTTGEGPTRRRKKRAVIAKLLKPIVGKPLSEQFKREPIYISALPSMPKHKGPAADGLENGNLTDLFSSQS